MTYHSGNQLINPQVLFEKAHLRPGAHVADFGCGQTGHLVFPASKIIGEKGVIYAVDILRDILAQIDKRAKDALDALTAAMTDSFRASPFASEMRSVNTVFMELAPWWAMVCIRCEMVFLNAFSED